MSINDIKAELASVEAELAEIKAAGAEAISDPAAVKSKLDRFDELKSQIKTHTESKARLEALRTREDVPMDEYQAKSLGDHFMHEVSGKLAAIKGLSGASVAAPEFKANTDSHLAGSTLQPFSTQVDKTDYAFRPLTGVSDLFSQGTLSGSAITWGVLGDTEGSAGPTAEGGNKNQIHVQGPTVKTEALKKITAWFSISEEMLEDYEFVSSMINSQGLWELSKAEENQLLNGTGANGQLQGVMGAPGIAYSTAKVNEHAQGLYAAVLSVKQVSGFDADAIVINPEDYLALRVAKDTTGQFFGGGYFYGPFGQTGVSLYPPLWGIPTIVTNLMSKGHACVGAFKAGGVVYRKGGIRVEATNSHADNFVKDMVTIRLEERILNTVVRPKCFNHVTLADK